MAVTAENLAKRDAKIVDRRAERDSLLAVEQDGDAEAGHKETISDIEVQFHALIRKRKELAGQVETAFPQAQV